MFGEGATCFGDRIYQLTWHEHAAIVYDNALNVIDVLHYDGEGWGLTHDRDQLIMSDGSATISFRDPRDFSIARTIAVHDGATRSEEHTSELQSLMRISYAVFCLKKKK